MRDIYRRPDIVDAHSETWWYMGFPPSSLASICAPARVSWGYLRPSRAHLITVSCECYFSCRYYSLYSVDALMFKTFAYINFNHLAACNAEDAVIVSGSLSSHPEYTGSRSSFSVHIVQTCINVLPTDFSHPIVANVVFMTGAIISQQSHVCTLHSFVHTYYS